MGVVLFHMRETRAPAHAGGAGFGAHQGAGGGAAGAGHADGGQRRRQLAARRRSIRCRCRPIRRRARARCWASCWISTRRRIRPIRFPAARHRWRRCFCCRRRAGAPRSQASRARRTADTGPELAVVNLKGSFVAVASVGPGNRDADRAFDLRNAARQPAARDRGALPGGWPACARRWPGTPT